MSSLAWISLCAAMAVGPGAAFDGLSIPAGPPVEVDGAIGEWTGVEPTLVLRPGLEGEGRHSVGGPFDDGDVGIEIWLRWHREALFFAVRWTDDIKDIEWVPQAMAEWIDPLGDARDRMYFFDDLVLRLFIEDQSYAVWLAPRSAPPGPYQWDVRRRLPTTPDTISVEVQATEAVARPIEGGVTLEGIVPWRHSGLRARAGRPFRMQVIAVDSDCPRVALVEKTRRCLEYHSWGGSAVFEKRRKR